MLRPIQSLSVDVIPQAVIALPVSKILGPKVEISKGNDDLDVYEGASFKLDNEIEIAVRHYLGHPKDTSTIYIDYRHRDVSEITNLIKRF